MADPITKALRPEETQRIKTLGSVQLHNSETRGIILVPTPSDDPNDPLNWSKRFRYYVAAVACFAVFVNNFIAAGPAVTIALQTIDFFGPPGPDFATNVGKVAYFFTGTNLVEGVFILLWMPLIVKFGRRQAYFFSYGAYTACSIWAGFAKSFGSELGARLMIGVFASAGLCVAPLTIADLFFLHERGAVMVWYTVALTGGGALGNTISGLITIHHTWRTIYHVTTAMSGFVFLLMFFTMPETSYKRQITDGPPRVIPDKKGAPPLDPHEKAVDIEHIETYHRPPHGPRRTYKESLKIFDGVKSEESLAKIFLRPFGAVLLPPVLWSTLVTAVSVGFLIAVTTNFASAFSGAYHWETWKIGLGYSSALVGSLLGIFAGGHFSDWVANVLTRRNGGMREPEMRLPALMVSVVFMTLSMCLYGAGIEQKMHWMVPTFANGLLSFAATQSMNIAMVYAIDCYRPISGEVVVAELAFKAFFGFMLSFYTNPWAEKEGYLNAFGAMAGIAAAVLIGWVPFYIWGKQIRNTTIHWRMFRWIDWHEDREVGE